MSKYTIKGQQGLTMNPDYWKLRYGFGTTKKPKCKAKDDKQPKIKKKTFKQLHPELYNKEVITKLRKQLINKYGYECMKCGSDKHIVLDHILSRWSGGTNDIDNLQLLCWNCNSDKGWIDTTDYRPNKKG